MKRFRSRLDIPPLSLVDKVPHYRKIDHIHTGYRYHPRRGEGKQQLDDFWHYSWYYCINSLFKVHNETINIWTHLLGSLYFLFRGMDAALLLTNDTYPQVDPDVLFQNQMVISVLSLCTSTAMFLSAFFHLFNPLSRNHHWRFRVADFSGISFYIVGCIFPLVYLTFNCMQEYLYWNTFVLMMLAIAGLIFPCFEIFHTAAYRNIRISIYILLATYPMWMWVQIVLLLGYPNETDSLFYLLLQTYLWYVIGLAFYITRFPENIWPGRFDIWFHSHQWWHVILIVGNRFYFEGILKHMHWRLSNPCVN
eukprot:TRINITY_DN3284_c0_g1_i1.p1 TRINITY_DN3284_c0_g1~~TRINITY_DN3284_c0_g1_i1.p1  ORF type:complete len:307 (-),score=26.46 TRINITY_DN3284_c0_g1_i1:99-1019(-)